MLKQNKIGKEGLTIQKKKVLTFLTIALLIIAAFYAGYTIASSSSTFTISSGVYPGAPSYTVWRDGNYYYAKNAYGAIDYSGTSASMVIQKAIDALSSRIIFIKAGEYGLSGKVVLKSNISLIGEGMGTKFKELIQGAILYGMNVENVSLENFFFDCGGFSALGADYAYACAIGFDSDGTKPLYNIVLRNIKTYNGAGAHIHFWGSDDTLVNVYHNVLLENVECDTNPYNGQSNPMLLLDYVDGATLINCYAHDVAGKSEGCIALDGKNIMAINCRGERGSEGIRIELGPRAGGNIKIAGGYFAYNGRGIILHPNASDVLISGVHFYRNEDKGIKFYSTGTQQRIRVEDCWIVESGYPNSEAVGLEINGDGVYDVKVERCTFINIGFGGTECRAISVVKGDNVQIIHNTIIDNRTTKITKWGIEFRSGSTTNVVCEHNYISGMTSEGITRTYGATVSGIIKDNVSDKPVLKTENSGTATISSGTSVTVNHGLAGTPTVVIVTPRSTGYGTFAVTARTSTTFTITVTTSGTYTFDWYAKCT